MERILNVNLRSVRLACQVFGKYMLDRSTRASIINVASLSGITPLSRVFTYAATKAAVINLTQNLAREWCAARHPRQFAVPWVLPRRAEPEGADPRSRGKHHAPHPAGPVRLPRRTGRRILLMASPKAGSFLTGANLVVDGGFTAMTI